MGVNQVILMAHTRALHGWEASSPGCAGLCQRPAALIVAPHGYRFRYITPMTLRLQITGRTRSAATSQAMRREFSILPNVPRRKELNFYSRRNWRLRLSAGRPAAAGGFYAACERELDDLASRFAGYRGTDRAPVTQNGCSYNAATLISDKKRA